MHLLVVNLQTPNIKTIEFWLQQVRTKTTGALNLTSAPAALQLELVGRPSATIFVGTHTDKFASQDAAEAALNALHQRVLYRFADFSCHCLLSTVTRDGFDALAEAVSQWSACSPPPSYY